LASIPIQAHEAIKSTDLGVFWDLASTSNNFSAHIGGFQPVIISKDAVKEALTLSKFKLQT